MKVKGNADDNEGDLLLLTKDIVEKMVELQNKTKTTALRGEWIYIFLNILKRPSIDVWTTSNYSTSLVYKLLHKR